MPYQSLIELPTALHALPEHAQEIYRASFNNAWETYADSAKRDGRSHEEVSHRVAWAAVRQAYYKQQNGNWKRKEN